MPCSPESPRRASTTTDASGNYSFAGLLSGSYAVREVLPPGYAQTCPVGYSSSVTALINRTTAAPVFGNVQISSVILNQAYFATLSANFRKAGTFATGDPNGDGTVNLADLLPLTRNFGHALPTLTVPAAIAVVANSAVLAAAQRRMR